MHEEFLNCKSEYAISDKESSDCISSDGEFVEANHILKIQEDDSFIDVVDKWEKENKGKFVSDPPTHKS